MTTTFAHLGLPNPLVQALTERGLVEAFPIQELTIPDALAGTDISGMAPTGSGKTLAFGLPLLAVVDQGTTHRPKALILAPTRELAEQIKRELAPLGAEVGRKVFAIYGGVGYDPQKRALRRGIDVLVATPGRLEDLIEQGSVDLRAVDFAVIDEADRMADMGFLPAVRRILDRTSARRQTLLFSATLDGDIAVLSRDYQHNPIRSEIGSVDSETVDARHHFWGIQHHDRVRYTADVIAEAGRSIVFTRTRRGADRLTRQLARLGIGAVALHGGRSQRQRSRALAAFSSGSAPALIATDVAARGIHVDAVESVIHFDPPADAKDYLHRSGRTARAGAAGSVVSLVTGEQERAVRRMQRDLGLEAPIETPRLEALHDGGHRIGDSPHHRPDRGPSARRKKTSSEKHQHHRSDPARSVYVANLPWKTTAEDIRGLFATYGDVAGSTIITDRKTGRSRGFGFVDMPHPQALEAVEALHGSTLDGRDLTVRLAQPRRHRS